MAKNSKHDGVYKEPGHFYSPVCDPGELRQYWDSSHRARQYARVDALLDYPAMLAFWRKIAPKIVAFPMKQTPDFRYYGENTEFMYFDASVLSGVLGVLNPKRIIEVGAGYSSAAMFDTIDRMKAPKLKSFTTIDPDLTRINRLSPPASSELIEAQVQSVPMERFAELEAGDIFFIDSSHVLKTGSDVHYEYLHILPELKPGVIIHVHDVCHPFEYPRRWTLQHNSSWNELCLVDMMLSHGDRYEVLFFNDAMLQKSESQMRKPGDMFDRFDAAQANAKQRLNGSIWLRKR